MSFTAEDHAFMAHALQLAAKGLWTTSPNPRVGCVIVRDGEIVGEGWHERAGEPHAEVHALRAAGDKARGATRVFGFGIGSSVNRSASFLSSKSSFTASLKRAATLPSGR